MPIVSTGRLTVTDVSDTPVISLTNNSHQVATDAYGLNGNYFGCNTTIRIYLGNQEVSASWAITATPSSGVTGTLSDRTYSVTAVTEDVGYVDFTATQFGWENLTTRFSITKSRRGEAGQALVILPSTLGFTFVDGVPSPQTQSIAFSAYKNGVVGDVEWQVSEGASLFTDTSAQGSMTGFLFGTPGTVVGDIAYMDVADMYDKNEVVVSATCDGVTASHVVMRLDAYTAEAGATRNVFQGDWVNGTTYAVGDVVVKDGYSWTCKVSTSSVAPPTYPTTSNANWGLSGEKGDSALAVIMPNDAHTLSASSAGVVSSYTGSGTTIEVMDGSTKLSASSTATASAFRITSTSVSPASSITVGAITYSGTTATVAAHSAMGNSNDTVQITYNITAYRANGTAVNLTKVQTLTKSKEGAAGQNATSYWLMSSAAAVQKSIAGAYTPTSVTYSIQSATGTSAPAAYAGRFIIATSTDGSTYTDQYTSLANESSKAYTVPASIKTIRVRAYLAGGTATLLDELITTVVSDGATGSSGASAVVAILSNEAHVFPAASDGAVSSYTGSGTKIRVYEGATELVYDGVGTSNSTWKIASSATNITVGTITDSGSYASVGVHSGVAAGTDTSSITYTLTGKTTAGTAFSITKDQTFTKAKAGSNGSKGDTGAQGPSVIVTTSRAATFTSTDGTLDASQADIVFTAAVSGVTSPTYAWTFSGLQTNPTASTTSTQTITAAQFGTSKSATVTCTVSGTYKDVVTIVRLEKSTAAAGATVGAPAGTYVGGTLAQTVESNASTALSTATTANNAVGNKLDKASSEILSVATTGTTRVAGLKAGDLVWDASGNRTSGKGVAITPSGILGHDGTKSTFAINATTGDATFSGTLNVASGTSGERMEITNSVIKVYDAAGVLRVKLGNLAL